MIKTPLLCELPLKPDSRSTFIKDPLPNDTDAVMRVGFPNEYDSFP